MRSKPVGEPSPKQSASFAITLKGTFNPLLHHPSWYYTVGQLAKDEVAATVAVGGVEVTPARSRFQAPAFRLDCTPGRWRVLTRDPAARLRLLQVATKTFENLLPETRLEEVGFRFDFALEVPHRQVVDFLSRTMWNLMPAESHGEVAATLENTVSQDEAPRRKRLQLASGPGAERARLTVSFRYPLTQDKIFTLRQLSVAEDFELDYDEALTYAEQLAYTLANAQATRLEN